MCNASDMPTSVWSNLARKNVEPPQSGRANDERRLSLGASRSCRPMERSENGHQPVLPSCARGVRCVLKMHRSPSSSGSARTSPALERLELCEAEVSSKVLRGALGGEPPAPPQ